MEGFSGVSPQALSDTIGVIYDCALAPDRWQDAVRRIIDLCESSSGGMCVHNFRNMQNEYLFELDYPPEWSARFQKHYPQSPLAAIALVAQVGEVHSLSAELSDEELFGSRFYKDLLKPFGYLDMIGLHCLKTSSRFAIVHAERTEELPRFGQRELNLFKLLSPHICRALTISDALDIRTLKSEMLEATLDGLAAGVYLLARDRRVVHMNAAAERQVKTGNALRISNNRLLPKNPEARDALAKAIDGAIRDETNPHAAGHSLAIPDTQGAGYVAIFLPLDCGERRSVVAPLAATVAIFVQEPAQAPLVPGQAFAKLYGLTGSELRVLLALAQGLGGKEAAEMLGISEPTVRTHLQRLFSKTGTKRQSELLHLFQRSTPPVAALPSEKKNADFRAGPFFRP
jgi:DNA-binding CsgD family transcriptional regulator/PAS domain-containing protein